MQRSVLLTLSSRSRGLPGKRRLLQEHISLQGVSAPPVGGSIFLNKVKMLDWSVADMRNLVVSSMPANNPGSLSPEQYADVLAYLLAANCYPSGDKSFPTSATPALKEAHLHPIQGAKQENPQDDTCPVK
jgi:hypothetical protein